MKNIILGKGQVGNCIAQIVKGDVEIYDKGQWESLNMIQENILHICIPYNDDFVKIVKQAKINFVSEITIVHSTVKEGTCNKIENCLYSPLEGRHHDDFSESIKNFKKFFAGSRKDFEMIKNHFDLDCQYWGSNTSELEFSKIMSTTYMYWCLLFEKTIYNESIKKGYDPNKTYKRWNRNYNEGYGKTHPQFKRPIYDHVESKTPGGHCLGPNIHLTDNYITEKLKEWEV